MAIYTFKRTMRYTEVIEVEAESLEEARKKAEAEDGVRNNDDTVVEMVQVS